jgi:hypothetical protein
MASQGSRARSLAPFAMHQRGVISADEHAAGRAKIIADG